MGVGSQAFSTFWTKTFSIYNSIMLNFVELLI